MTSTLAPDDIYLGRAWKPYTGAVPQQVVRNTNLPAQVNAADPYLGISGATWTAGRYGEYDNTGYGANPANPDRPQLTDAQAAGYTAQTYLAGRDGWDPVAPPGGRTVAGLAQEQSSRTGDTRPITQPTPHPGRLAAFAASRLHHWAASPRARRTRCAARTAACG